MSDFERTLGQSRSVEGAGVVKCSLVAFKLYGMGDGITSKK